MKFLELVDWPNIAAINVNRRISQMCVNFDFTCARTDNIGRPPRSIPTRSPVTSPTRSIVGIRSDDNRCVRSHHHGWPDDPGPDHHGLSHCRSNIETDAAFENQCICYYLPSNPFRRFVCQSVPKGESSYCSLYLYFQYLLSPFVVSAITSALGTEINRDVIETSCANANRLDSLECHNCCAAGTIDILFPVLIHPYSLDRRQLPHCTKHESMTCILYMC
jgi:hypothetical protein